MGMHPRCLHPGGWADPLPSHKIHGILWDTVNKRVVSIYWNAFLLVSILATMIVMVSVNLDNLIKNNVNTAGEQTNVQSVKIVNSLVSEVVINRELGLGVFDELLPFPTQSQTFVCYFKVLCFKCTERESEKTLSLFSIQLSTC